MGKTICKIMIAGGYRDDLIKAAEEELGNDLSEGWRIESTVPKSKMSFYIILSKQVKDSPYR